MVNISSNNMNNNDDNIEKENINIINNNNSINNNRKHSLKNTPVFTNVKHESTPVTGTKKHEPIYIKHESSPVFNNMKNDNLVNPTYNNNDNNNNNNDIYNPYFNGNPTPVYNITITPDEPRDYTMKNNDGIK